MEQALHTSRWFGFVCGVFFSVVQEISHNLGVCYMYLKHFNKVTKHSASLPDRGSSSLLCWLGSAKGSLQGEVSAFVSGRKSLSLFSFAC